MYIWLLRIQKLFVPITVPRKEIVLQAAIVRDRSCRFEICIVIQRSRKASEAGGFE